MTKFNIYRLNRSFGVLSLLLLLLIGLMRLSSCITAGTHGSVETYNYSVSKYILETAVNKVLASNSNIKRAAITDSFTSKYYNDGKRYVSIQILVEGGYNEYTFQYTGEKEYWDTAKNSEIAIVYAYDKNGKGGSEGNGGLNKSGLRDKLVNVFENVFINKINKELRLRSITFNSFHFLFYVC